MILHAMGMNLCHEPTFQIVRPQGSGDNLLLIFKTDAFVWKKEERQLWKTGSFILYKKNEEQHYGAAAQPYQNHYIHFDSCGDAIFDQLGLLTNRPGYLQNLEEIETLLRLLGREQISDSSYRNDNADFLLQVLFRKLAENQSSEPLLQNNLRHLEELTNLRSEMYSTPAKYKNIRDLAQAVALSTSHFQALYSEFFGVSCYEDLLNAKISNGKDFLTHPDMSVHEIAALCGYENDTCFMRAFKKRTGVTPSEYRATLRK